MIRTCIFNKAFSGIPFLQVRFHYLSIVTEVATQGVNMWVTRYRLAYSEDSVTFDEHLDVSGNDIVINIFVGLYA